MSGTTIDVYLEQGAKRTFAGALAWPGWCRSGRDEAAALQSLLEYAPRYVALLAPAGLKLRPPVEVGALVVAERLDGTATTDFGAPGVAPAFDSQPIDAAELRRLQAILEGCWGAFDRAVEAAAGKELRKGPRGGGRELAKVVAHVLESSAGYLRQLGGSVEQKPGPSEEWQQQLIQATLATLAAAAKGELPPRGPRGGERWTPRYFVRRTAWHLLDHAWELEDRSA